MWNYKLYHRTVKRFAKEESFNVKTEKDVYKYLAKKLYVSQHTAKSWTREKSNGPGDNEVLDNLEQLLGVTLYIKEENVETIERNIVNIKYSDFVKQEISACYKIIMMYIQSEEVEDENVYSAMRRDLRLKKISVPNDIYLKFESFANTYLDPIIYDNETTFAASRTEDIGQTREDGSFVIKNEEKFLKCISKYFEVLVEIENKFEDFAIKEIYPLLVS